jgi:uncharacterized phage-associated protein
MTANVFDTAKFILLEQGPISAMKLQKLVYYSQAWSLVWDGRPLFREKIKAWAMGPVVPALYAAHKGRFTVNAKDIAGDADALDVKAKATVLGVLKFYGDKTAQWLSDLTHAERPWCDARRGIPPGANCNNEITAAALEEYYSSLK